jgi:hypothetical protein
MINLKSKLWKECLLDEKEAQSDQGFKEHRPVYHNMHCDKLRGKNFFYDRSKV